MRDGTNNSIGLCMLQAISLALNYTIVLNLSLMILKLNMDYDCLTRMMASLEGQCKVDGPAWSF